MKEYSTRPWTILLLILGISLSLGASWLLYFSEQEQLHNRFVKDVSDRSAVFSRELNTSLETLYTLRTLFIAQAIPHPDDFTFVSENSRNRHNDIVAVYWLPEIGAQKRSRFVDDLSRLDGYSDFRILEQTPQGLLTPSEQKVGVHRPIVYFQGESSQKLPIGLDLRGNASIDPLLSKAKASGQVELAPGRIELNDNLRPMGEYQSSMIIAAIAIPLRGYPGHVAGYIVAVLNLKISFEDALEQVRVAGIDMKLWDQTGQGEPILLHHHISRTRLEVDPARSVLAPMQLLGNREWFVEAIPTFYYFNSKTTWLPHLIFLLGVALTTLMIFVFLRIARKNARIRQETRQLMTSNQELAEISRTDALTGVANRRYFDETLDKEWKRAQRTQAPLTLIMVDIDCFKLYNDYYGHLEGDECIHTVAQALKDMMSRPMDLVARFGGEEFAILLPDTNENAIILAEQCRKVIEQQRLPHAASKVSPYVTVSMGIATLYPEADQELSELIRQADRALYRAKSDGRNQVVQAGTETVDSDGPSEWTPLPDLMDLEIPAEDNAGQVKPDGSSAR